MRSLTKRAGSGARSASGSVSQMYRSEAPDQNGTDPEHCINVSPPLELFHNWYLSNLFRVLFHGENEFMICLRESFPHLKTRLLTRVEWCKVSSSQLSYGSIWIRIRIRILLFSSVAFKMPTKNYFFQKFFAYAFVYVCLHQSLKIKVIGKSQRSGNKGFS